MDDVVVPGLYCLLGLSLGLNAMAALWCDKVGQENKRLKARLRFVQCLAEDVRAELGMQ